MLITPLRRFAVAISIVLLFSLGILIPRFLFPLADVNDYYVATTGSDSNDGSQAHPWATLQKAATSLVLGPGGTIVHVAPGDYNSYVTCNIPALNINVGEMVCMQQSGTPTQPIIFQSDRKWQAKLSCNVGHTSALFLLDASYISVVGFDMTCPQGTYAAGVYGDNGHNQYIGNYIHDFDTSGCHSVGTLQSNAQPLVTYTNIGHQLALGNVIRHIGAEAGAPSHCNQEHGLYFGNPYDAAINNVVSGVIGWGIHMYGNGICHQIVANNTVFDNAQGGIAIENVGGTGGSHIDLCGNGGATDYETVIDNIVVNNGIGNGYTGQGGICGRAAYVGSHNLYSNNLLYGNANFDISLYSPDVSLNQITGSNASVFQNYQDDPNWKPAPGYNYLDYALAEGSPATHAGTTNCVSGLASCAPAFDITGVPRPSNVIDTGAFQFLPGVVITGPVSVSGTVAVR
jgi:hypothetical protein